MLEAEDAGAWSGTVITMRLPVHAEPSADIECGGERDD
jgi:hypothetical protein